MPAFWDPHVVAGLRPANVLGELASNQPALAVRDFARDSVPYLNTENVSALATIRPITGHLRILVLGQASSKTFPCNRFLPPRIGIHRANMSGM